MRKGNVANLEKELSKIEKQIGDGEASKEKMMILLDLAYELHRNEPGRTDEYARQALVLAEKLDDKNSIARSHQLIGISYTVKSDYEKASEYILGALAFYEQSDNKRGVADCCNNIGFIHSSRGDNDKALEYLFRGLALNKEIDSKTDIANNYNSIGTVYHEMGDYGQALEYLVEALKLYEEFGSEIDKINPYMNIGTVYYMWEDYEKATDYFLKALEKAEEFGDKRSACICQHNMGDTHLRLKRYESALEYLERSLKFANEAGDRRMEMLNYEFLSKLYEAQGDYEKSLSYYKKFGQLKSEIFTEENSEKIARIEMKFEIERKEKEAEIFRLKNVELEEMVAERTTELGSEIIERTRAQEALRESEERYRSLQANIPVGVFRTTPAGEYLSANVALADMLGYGTIDGLIGIPVADVYASPEGRKGFIDSIDKEGMVVDFETQLKRKDDMVIWVSFNSRAVTDENGDIIHYDGIVEDISERKRAEEQIKSSLAEKEVLLREVHHRVKNNMQIISSLLNLQAGQVGDEQLLAVFKESQNRIKAMSLIHESLYASGDFTQINFAEYVQTLIQRTFSVYSPVSRKISLEVNVDDVYLDINTSIPVALIINELVTNVVQHAFPEGRKGRLTIGFEEYEVGKYSLKVADDGVGLPDGFDPEELDSLGMGLITALVKQIDGELRIDGEDGAVFSIKFGLKEDE